jgi:hypothetical protein
MTASLRLPAPLRPGYRDGINFNQKPVFRKRFDSEPSARWEIIVREDAPEGRTDDSRIRRLIMLDVNANLHDIRCESASRSQGRYLTRYSLL